jgi:hypothetical protein
MRPLHDMKGRAELKSGEQAAVRRQQAGFAKDRSACLVCKGDTFRRRRRRVACLLSCAGLHPARP